MDRPGPRVDAAQAVTRAGGGDQFAFGRLQAKAFSGDRDAAAEGDAVIILEYIFLDAGRFGLRRHGDPGKSVGLLHTPAPEGYHAAHPGGDAGRGVEVARQPLVTPARP